MPQVQKFYVVTHGRQVGIYHTWDDASRQVHGFSGAIYKTFFSKEEAERFLKRSTSPPTSQAEEVPGLLPYCGSNIAYTDGSSNKGLGGYGVVIIKSSEIKEFSGPVPLDNGEVTNNVAELYAIIVAIFNTEGPLTIRTDSMYCINCVTVWIKNWMANGWRTAGGNIVANQKYIQYIYNAMQTRKISFEHVRGHTGNHYNERADQLANAGRALNTPK